MGTVGNLRVGLRRADEIAALREHDIDRARKLLEREFIDAVLANDPREVVSLIQAHSHDRETISILDLLHRMLDEADGIHMQRLLHMLARDDDETVAVLHQLAEAYADDQVDLMLQRGAL